MITNSIINNNFVEENLINIIPSSILLDGNNNILSASKEVCQFLRFSNHELRDKNILEVLMARDNELEKGLNSMRINGYFKPKKISIHNKYKKNIDVEISGFYLGIISDFTEYTIVGIRDIDKLKTYQRLFEEKKNDLNELVYRTYHDLRGPVATIKGLVNVSDYSQDTDESKDLFKLIGDSTDILKDRISNISLIFDNSYEDNIKVSLLNNEFIRLWVINTIQEKLRDVDIEVSVINTEFEEISLSEEDIHKMLRYSLLGFLSFHKAVDRHVKVVFTFNVDQDNFIFSFKFEGFTGNSTLFENAVFNKHKFSELINEENVLNFYLLRNLIQKYNGIFIPQFEHNYKKGFKIALEVN